MIGSGSDEEDYRDKSARANRSEISVAHRPAELVFGF